MGPAIKDVCYEVGHCVLNMGFTWTFLGKQNATAKMRYDVLSVRFLGFMKSFAESMGCMKLYKTTKV